MSEKRKTTSQNIRKLTALGVFAALAYVIHFVHVPVSFLNLDFKDVIMTVAGMYFGPVSGVAVAILVPLLEFPTSETGVYGLIMNLLSSITFVGVASLIYKRKKTLNGALLGFLCAVIATTSIMLLLNMFVTPLYMAQIGVPLDTAGIIDMIPLILLPFNLSKAVINSSLAMMLYKPISSSLRRIGFATGDAKRMTFNRASLVITVVGVILIVAAVLVLIFVPQLA